MIHWQGIMRRWCFRFTKKRQKRWFLYLARRFIFSLKQLVEYVYSQKDLLRKFLRQIAVKTLTDVFTNLLAVECTKFEAKIEEYKVKRETLLWNNFLFRSWKLKLWRNFCKFYLPQKIQRLNYKIKIKIMLPQEVRNSASIITHILRRYSLIWDGIDMLNFFLRPENILCYFDHLKTKVIWKKILFFKKRKQKGCNRKYILEIISILANYYCPFEDETSLVFFF